MIYLTNAFWRIGTYSDKYFENYYLKINHYDIFTEFVVEKDGKLVTPETVIDFGSEATLNQNIVSWCAFGFVAKKGNKKFVKIIDNKSKEFLYEHSKGHLFVISSDEQIKRYRSMIVLICLANMNFEAFKKMNIKAIKSNKINHDIIKKQLSDYERYLLKDESFKKILKIYGEENFYEHKTIN